MQIDEVCNIMFKQECLPHVPCAKKCPEVVAKYLEIKRYGTGAKPLEYLRRL